MNKTIKQRLVLKKKVKKELSRLLLSIIVFLIGMILVRNPDIKKKIEYKLYEENFPFQKIKILKDKYLGKYLSLEKLVKEEKPVFNEKLSYEKKEKYKDGVKLKVSNNYLVPTLESGVVVFIGEKENYGNTIVVEQTDGIEVFYSNIKLNNIKLYDYLEKGELLGEVNDNTLYLVFEKEGKYLDYKEYI